MTAAEPGRLRRAASTVRHWRDWPLATKLVAMMLAPAAVIVALGGVLVSSQVHAARADATQAALVRLEVRAHSVVSALDRAPRRGPPGRALSHAANSFRAAVRGGEPGAGLAPDAMPDQVSARAGRAEQKLRSALGSRAGSASAYGDARGALLGVEQSVANHVAEPNLTDLAASLHSSDSSAKPSEAAAAAATAKKLSSTARGLANSSSNRIGITAVLLFVAVVVCAALAVIIARALVISLGRLRRHTEEVAERGLPEAVRRAGAGKQISTDVVTVAVSTGDEIGALARSFEAVQGQALRLAAEQASLRSEAGGVFVNLSRRSQSLVQRQLRLLERLERDEEDPGQLDTLFQLDHLATRMRRNNENLMVLSGADPGRGGTATMTVSEVLQAAVSEIEQYQRVRIAAAAEATVVGYAASDLVRMLAELLDNATSFSAPETTVALTGEQIPEGALRLEVLDQGVGMTGSDLADANSTLATSGRGELPATRQMGLFVVGQLAAQHGVTVGLAASEDGQGLRARLVLPSALLARTVDEPGAEVAGRGAAQPRAPLEEAGSPPQEERQTPLPTRQRGQAARQAGIPVGAPSTEEHDDEPAPALPAPSEQEATETIQGSWLLPGPRTGQEPPVDLFGPEAPAAAPGGSAAPAAEPGGGAAAAASRDEAQEQPFDAFATAAPRQEPVSEPSGAPEGTPIFDDIASAWFSDLAAGGPDSLEGAPARPGGPAFPGVGWSEADSGWQQADAVARQAPGSFTESGLPVRTPRARLVPGSMDAEDEQSAPVASNTTHRDADQVRDRYSGLVRGLTEAGRTGPAEQQPGRQPDGDEVTPAGLPKRRRGAGLVPQHEAGEAASSSRNSEHVRERLASLQSGISRGRADRESQPNGAEEADDW
jgi:signal transduction histidine kinase